MAARLEAAEPGPKYRGLDRLAGQQIRAVERRGKFLVLPLLRQGSHLEDLIIHLGMTGVISAAPQERTQHLRVSLDLSPGGATVILGDAPPVGDRLYIIDHRR